jgi:diguanylate cyclase (GGDEF)-like protein/PAS domain S-box-containing protein
VSAPNPELDDLSTINQYIRAIIFVCDMQTNRVLFANGLAKNELGIDTGQSCCQDIYAYSERCSCHNNRQLMDNPCEPLVSQWYNPKVSRWFDRRIQAVPWTGGKLARLETLFDITHLMSFGEDAPYESAYSHLILESIGDGVIVTDDTGIITMMNPQAQRLTGWSGSTGVGEELTRVFHIINTQTRQVVEDPVAKVLASGKTIGLANHTSLLSSDGTEYHISDSAAPVKDKDGNIHGVILVFRDVSDDYRQQEELRRSEERFRTLMETAINAIALHEIVLDDRGLPVNYRFLEVNKAFEALTGMSAEQLVGKTVLEVLPGTEKVWIDTYGEVALTGISRDIEDFSQDLSKYFSVRAYSPKRGRFVTVFEDITERKQMEERLREQAYRDSLTGLHNRRYLDKKLPTLDQEKYLPISVIIGDVNGLKIINDSMGHQKGDEIVKRAAQAFREAARPGDLVVRWGGDEFLLFLPRTESQEAQLICTAINGIALAMRDTGLEPSIALGYATKNEFKQDLSDTVRQAETSMYQQKISTAESRRSALVLSLQQALAEKSHETEAHARHLQVLAVTLAQRLGLSDGEIVTCSLAALLHDIGKIAISESILDKPGPLNAEEWKAMRRHSEIGHRIVSSSPDLLDVAEGVLHHHERWDGKGYPHGLRGRDIPISARIIALADAFDAMTTDRAYHSALSQGEAVAEIATLAGSQFDPELAREFLAMLAEDKGDSDLG